MMSCSVWKPVLKWLLKNYELEEEASAACIPEEHGVANIEGDETMNNEGRAWQAAPSVCQETWKPEYNAAGARRREDMELGLAEEHNGVFGWLISGIKRNSE